MPLRLFNTYSRDLEEFRAARSGTRRKIDIYTCGPTVYSRAHIGNFRAYIFEDLLQRHLELRGLQSASRHESSPTWMTKRFAARREANLPLPEFTEPFKQAFFEDMRNVADQTRR